MFIYLTSLVTTSPAYCTPKSTCSPSTIYMTIITKPNCTTLLTSLET